MISSAAFVFAPMARFVAGAATAAGGVAGWPNAGVVGGAAAGAAGVATLTCGLTAGVTAAGAVAAVVVAGVAVPVTVALLRLVVPRPDTLVNPATALVLVVREGMFVFPGARRFGRGGNAGIDGGEVSGGGVPAGWACNAC